MLYQLSYTPARVSGASRAAFAQWQATSAPFVARTGLMHAPASPPIAAETLLLAYRSGLFPMSDSREDEEVFWVEPRKRAVIPLDGFHCSRSLAKVLKADRFEVSVDGDFAAVIDACAAPRPGHPETWINRAIDASYRNLNALGHAHSVECRIDGELVGGLYGVSFERVFCGESMFSRARDASKVALAWLVALMRSAGFQLLDCQFMTEHLASLGAVEIERADYLDRLAQACSRPPRLSLPQAYSELSVLADEGRDSASSSPGKLISQSFTQTS